jgi:hypothetical protein
MTLRTGSGGAQVKTVGEGIHWHIANHVEYVRDEETEEIRWVRATFPDDRVVAYNDVSDPLSPEEIEAAEPTGIDCVDCHNQVGHPFYAPDRLVDLALETGQLSSELPYIKSVVVNLLSEEYATQAEAIAAMDLVPAQYETEYPAVAEKYRAEIREAVEVAKSLAQVVIFETAGLTWESFPDHSGHGGHKPFPGCFRCHNGKFQSEDGTPIRVQCTLCHSIPEKAGPSDEVPTLPAASRQQPESHQAADFLADHRWQADEACSECHGEIAFGTDDSSFCANSACHGHEWPELELDPTQEHPIPLVGEHAEVWCHDCHAGARMPEYECDNCHEPPADHYTPPCDACHSPVAWSLVRFGDVEEPFDTTDHRFPLDHGGADRDCRLCHPQGDGTAYTCSVCHQPQRTRTVHAGTGIEDIVGKCTDCHP